MLIIVLGAVSAAWVVPLQVAKMQRLGELRCGHRIKDYLEETNVQLGASYNVAKQSTEAFEQGMQAAAAFISADVQDVGIEMPS